MINNFEAGLLRVSIMIVNIVNFVKIPGYQLYA